MGEHKDEDIRIFLARSKLRRAVLQELAQDNRIASFIAKKLGRHRVTISRILLGLKDMELVKCINEAEPHFHKYELTSKGRKFLKL